jgi:hypothetical protein
VTGALRQIEFLLRDKPEAGALGELMPLPRQGEFNRVAVTYTADPQGTAATDEFSFAARLPGGVPSRTAVVKVTITSPSPELEAPPSVSFGDVAIGQSSTRAIPLKNVGTGAYVARLELAPPWAVGAGSSDRLEVAPDGGTAALRITFSPVRPGPERQVFQLEGAAGGGGEAVAIELVGVGVAPFSVTPAEFVLVDDPESGGRSGELTVRNALPQPVVLTVTGGESLGLPASIGIGASGELRLTAALAGSPGGFRGSVVFGGGSFSTAVTVSAPPLPARVEAVTGTDGAFALQPVLPGVKRAGSVKVRNSGGSPGDVVAEVSVPFALADDDRSFSLAPGEERDIDIEVVSRITGEFQSPLKLYCSGLTTEVPLAASVVNQLPDTAADNGGASSHAAQAPAARLSHGPGPAAGSRQSGDAQFRQAILFQHGLGAPRETNADVPVVPVLRLVKRSGDYVTLSWEEPPGGPFSYQFEIERLVYFPQQQLPLKIWLAYEKVDFETEGNVVTATLKELKAGADYRWRLLTHQDGLGWSLPSRPFTAGTAIPGRWPWKWIAVGLLSAAVGGWWVRQKVRAARD